MVGERGLALLSFNDTIGEGLGLNNMKMSWGTPLEDTWRTREWGCVNRGGRTFPGFAKL